VPQIDDALIEVTKAVSDPRTGRSVYDGWNGDSPEEPTVDRLGSGSDYTAWYLGHAGSARITGVTALRLANADVLPFHYSDYAAAVASYVRELQQVQAETPGAARVDLGILLEAAEGWRQASTRLEARADRLLEAGDTESRAASRAIRRINAALMRQERALTTSRGLPGRPWFRHQVYAPGLVTGYAVQYLPGIRDAVDQGDEQTATTYRDLLLDSLRDATRLAHDAS
jgi:N-acetylated-alpha-linked acidic dipeptidase